MGATLKVWSGSAWVAKPVKVWSGSAWVAKPVKYWDGSAWIGGATTPTYRSHTISGYSSVANAILNKPSGVVSGDILVCCLFQALSGSPPTLATPPSGWAQVGTAANPNAGLNGKCSIWWLRAGGSEPSTYQWSYAASYSTQGFIGAYSGCISSGSPVDVFSQNTANSGATATGTGVTTTGANRLLLWLGNNWDGSGTLTPPSGMTERADSVVYAAEQLIASAGATGNKTQTQAGSNPWSVFLVALKGN